MFFTEPGMTAAPRTWLQFSRALGRRYSGLKGGLCTLFHCSRTQQCQPRPTAAAHAVSGGSLSQIGRRRAGTQDLKLSADHALAILALCECTRFRVKGLGRPTSTTIDTRGQADTSKP